MTATPAAFSISVQTPPAASIPRDSKRTAWADTAVTVGATPRLVRAISPLETEPFEKRSFAVVLSSLVVSSVTGASLLGTGTVRHGGLVAAPLFGFMTPLIGVGISSYLKHRQALARELAGAGDEPQDAAGKLKMACDEWRGKKANGAGVHTMVWRIVDFDEATGRSLSEDQLAGAICGLIRDGVAHARDYYSLATISSALRTLIEDKRCSAAAIERELRSAFNDAPTTGLEPDSAMKAEFVARTVEWMMKEKASPDHMPKGVDHPVRHRGC
ncbi:hypothetical protein [Ramlibacter rhizophilus]|uniref:Uncharacterized protein n=1 Tax=Ramlibacter rhizophilus TaxID=1781167 RepID=A0A4Z0BQ80_9BURK|nr:hypothetical protein [Ramlibacter rhizophilus]TFZ01476.1 hypothetical protein EZ242_08880 [Ramlibacter rhizophilus]